MRIGAALIWLPSEPLHHPGKDTVFKAGGKRGRSRRFRIMIKPFTGEGRKIPSSKLQIRVA
jgi:hypothetical protein